MAQKTADGVDISNRDQAPTLILASAVTTSPMGALGQGGASASANSSSGPVETPKPAASTGAAADKAIATAPSATAKPALR